MGGDIEEVLEADPEAWVTTSAVTIVSMVELPGKWESSQLGCQVFCVSLS